MWCGRRSSPDSASSTYVFFGSLSCARRMPRREGEVFRFGTAMAGELLVPAARRESGADRANGASRQASAPRRNSPYPAALHLPLGLGRRARRKAMKIREAMTSDVRTVGPEATIREAARLMAEGDVGALPVAAGD